MLWAQHSVLLCRTPFVHNIFATLQWLYVASEASCLRIGIWRAQGTSWMDICENSQIHSSTLRQRHVFGFRRCLQAVMKELGKQSTVEGQRSFLEASGMTRYGLRWKLGRGFLCVGRPAGGLALVLQIGRTPPQMTGGGTMTIAPGSGRLGTRNNTYEDVNFQVSNCMFNHVGSFLSRQDDFPTVSTEANWAKARQGLEHESFDPVLLSPQYVNRW